MTLEVKGATEIAFRIRNVHHWASEEVSTAIRDTVSQQERRFKKGRFTGYTGQSRSNRVQNRSGFLKNSVVALRPKRKDKAPEGRVLVTAPYAALQEFGDTITGNPFLRIPIGEGLTRAGVSRYTMVKTASGWKTSDGDPTFIRGGVIFRVGTTKTGRNKKGQKGSRQGPERPVPIAVLKRSVTVKPRLGFFLTWRRLERWRELRWQKAIDLAVGRKR